MAFPLGMQIPPEHDGPLPDQADVVIIGAGIIGVMTAYFLARKGLRAVVLEKGRVAAEQSSRNWGWIRQMGRDADELPIMKEACRIWADLADEVDDDLGLKTCGLTYLAKTEADLARYESWIADVSHIGVDSQMLSRAETRALLPDSSVDWAGAMHTPSDMRAEPWVAVPIIARAAKKHGVEIIEGCAAGVLDITGGRVSGIWTERGLIRAPEIVVAGGAWSSLFLRRHGVDIPQLSVRATVVATEPVETVTDGGAGGDGLAFRRRQDGGYTLAPGGFHDIWIGPDALRHALKFRKQLMLDPFGRRYHSVAPKGYPDAWGQSRHWDKDDETPFERMRVLDPGPNEKKAREVVQGFGAMFPKLGSVRAKAAWGGMIDVTPDIVPVVDRAGQIPGLSICTGMCGHGFGIGPGFGRVMANLVVGEDIGHDLSRFRLARFSDGTKMKLGPTI